MQIRRLLRLLEDRPELFKSDLEWAICDAIIANPKLADNLPLLQVRTEHLQPTQAHLDDAKVADYVKRGITDGIIVIRRGDCVYVLDGHHRWASAKQLDKPTIWSKVIEMPNSCVDLDQFGKILQTSKTSILKAMHPADRP